MAVALLLSVAAWACPVCQDPTDVRAAAYFDMTIFLSLLPLLAMASIGWWIWRRTLALDAEP
jgi:hypothetical protein